jgi:chemotaxis response regulator CheB
VFFLTSEQNKISLAGNREMGTEIIKSFFWRGQITLRWPPANPEINSVPENSEVNIRSDRQTQFSKNAIIAIGASTGATEAIEYLACFPLMKSRMKFAKLSERYKCLIKRL